MRVTLPTGTTAELALPATPSRRGLANANGRGG